MGIFRETYSLIKGLEKSAGKQQVYSSILYSAVKKISNEFPLLKEARREVFEDMMDIGNAKKILELIEKNKIKIKNVNLPIASPFGLNCLFREGWI